MPQKSDVDITLDLLEILEEMNPDLWEPFKDPESGIANIPYGTSLNEMDIGGFPIGHAELLEFKDRVEKKFGFLFNSEDLPGFFESGGITFRQIVDAVQEKTETASTK